MLAGQRGKFENPAQIDCQDKNAMKSVMRTIVRVVNYDSSSITPTGERLTGIRSILQWADVGWNKVEKHVNRLQARITKAVKEQKWHLGQRKKQPLRIPTVNDRIVQMLHVLSLNGKEISRYQGLLRLRNTTETNCCPIQKGL